MGLFDSLVGAVESAASGGQAQGQNGLAEIASQLISNQGAGGLGGLVKTFEDNGLGHLMASWIGNGQNLPISAEQIQQVLGSEQVKSIATRLGLPADAVASGLSTLLPQMVNHVTPDGQVPQDNQLIEQGLSMLKSKLLG